MNRIIDSNVFGCGGLDKPIFVDKPDEKTDFVVTDDMKSWFECRNISYYHDEEKGILFLQFSSTRCPLMEGNLESKMGFDSLLEDYEYGDLQAMLFMFSVSFFLLLLHFKLEIPDKFVWTLKTNEASEVFESTNMIRNLCGH